MRWRTVRHAAAEVFLDVIPNTWNIHYHLNVGFSQHIRVANSRKL